MAASVDDLKSCSHDLAVKGVHKEIKNHAHFFFCYLHGYNSKRMYELFFPTIGLQLIFLISRPLPSVVMGAVE